MSDHHKAYLLIQQQAKDTGLWFTAQTNTEAYLQQQLKKLHAAVKEQTADDKREIEAWKENYGCAANEVKELKLLLQWCYENNDIYQEGPEKEAVERIAKELESK